MVGNPIMEIEKKGQAKKFPNHPLTGKNNDGESIFRQKIFQQWVAVVNQRKSKDLACYFYTVHVSNAAKS